MEYSKTKRKIFIYGLLVLMIDAIREHFYYKTDVKISRAELFRLFFQYEWTFEKMNAILDYEQFQAEYGKSNRNLNLSMEIKEHHCIKSFTKYLMCEVKQHFGIQRRIKDIEIESYMIAVLCIYLQEQEKDLNRFVSNILRLRNGVYENNPMLIRFQSDVMLDHKYTLPKYEKRQYIRKTENNVESSTLA